MAAATSCSLRAKRLLLEPRFEGYKLSLEPLACYRLGLADGNCFSLPQMTRDLEFCLCGIPNFVAVR